MKISSVLSFSLLFLLLIPLKSAAQQNELYAGNVATLQVVAGDNWLSMPITQLNGEPVNISFDELSHDYHRFTYTIEHCDADWSKSENLFPSDFLAGFTEGNTITDVRQSNNTNVLYTHYSLRIPNNRCQITMSGNYRLNVFDENNNNEKVLSACFMVVEPLAEVGLSVTSNTDMDVHGRHQQVGMEVVYPSLNVVNVDEQIRTVVLQNGRWDNARWNLKPQYEKKDGLEWSHHPKLIFDAGNEYHKFEVLDVTHTTLGLDDIGWDGKDYHAYVQTDFQRRSYVYDKDANGAFYIRNSDNMENNTSSDYLLVHFSMSSPRYAENIYLNGAWTNGRFLPEYQMIYNDSRQVYQATVLLKQGYYSYQYLKVNRDGTASFLPTEGNFSQTENKYQALVYYRAIGERADRLVGYQEVVYK